MTGQGKRMKVKDVEFDFINGKPGRTDAGNYDWDLANEHYTFDHKEACEFIFFIQTEESVWDLEAAGFSERFMSEVKRARKEGYNYICFYS